MSVEADENIVGDNGRSCGLGSACVADTISNYE